MLDFKKYFRQIIIIFSMCDLMYILMWKFSILNLHIYFALPIIVLFGHYFIYKFKLAKIINQMEIDFFISFQFETWEHKFLLYSAQKNIKEVKKIKILTVIVNIMPFIGIINLLIFPFIIRSIV